MRFLDAVLSFKGGIACCLLASFAFAWRHDVDVAAGFGLGAALFGFMAGMKWLVEQGGDDYE